VSTRVLKKLRKVVLVCAGVAGMSVIAEGKRDVPEEQHSSSEREVHMWWRGARVLGVCQECSIYAIQVAEIHRGWRCLSEAERFEQLQYSTTQYNTDYVNKLILLLCSSASAAIEMFVLATSGALRCRRR